MSNNNLKKSGSKQPLIEEKKSQNYSTSTEINNKDSSEVATLGKHFIIDFWGAKSLDDLGFIEHSLIHAAKSAEAVLLHIHLHKFSDGGGVTGVALLAESHISIHTWPECNYAAFDVFMCGESHPEKAVAYLQNVFNPTKVESREISRGAITTSN